MDRNSITARLIATTTIGALALFSVGFTWAAVDDYTTRQVLPKGSSVEGVAVGGMTHDQAVRVIEQQVKGPLFAPLDVSFMGSSTMLEPSRFVRVDISGALEKAASARTGAVLPARVWQRLSGQEVGDAVTGIAKVDARALAAWIKDQKARLSAPAVDATIVVKGSTIDFRAAKDGATIDQTATLTLLSEALLQGSKQVELPQKRVEPKVTEDSIGKTILVSRSNRSLKLYDGFEIEKSYRCAVGTPQFPTPLGKFKIIQKRFLPTWRNPGSDWAKDMPAYIGPGPSNPLGTRALNLNAPGIRIHGTTKDSSIGTAASHGCMRMHMWDIEDLYPRVPMGTRVFIVP